MTAVVSALLLGFGGSPANAASCRTIQQQIDVHEAALKEMRGELFEEHFRKRSELLKEVERAWIEENQARDELQAGKCYVLSNRHRPDCVTSTARAEKAKGRHKRALQEHDKLGRIGPGLGAIRDLKDKRDQLLRELEACKKGSGTAWVPIPVPPALPCPAVRGWDMPCSRGSIGPLPAPANAASGAPKSPGAGGTGTPKAPPASGGKCTIGNTLVGQGCVQ